MADKKKIALIDTEEGFASVANLIDEGKVELFPANSFEKADAAVAKIFKDADKYSRVVLDPVTTMATTLNNTLTLKGSNVVGGIWEKRNSLRIAQDQWGQMSTMVILLTRTLYELPCQVVLTCHEGTRENPFDGIEMHAPDLNRMILKDLYGYCDAIVRLGKMPQKGVIDGKDVPAGTRVLRLQDSPQYMAKGRDTLPYSRPELLANPSMSSFLSVCKPSPRKIVVYGPPGVGKTVFACSE